MWRAPAAPSLEYGAKCTWIGVGDGVEMYRAEKLETDKVCLGIELFIKVAGGVNVLVDSVMRQGVGVTVGSVEIVSDNM